MTDTFAPLEQVVLDRFLDFDYGRRRILGADLVTDIRYHYPWIPVRDPYAPLDAIRAMEEQGYIEYIKNPKNSRDLQLLQLSHKGREAKDALKKHEDSYLKEPIGVTFTIKSPAAKSS